MRMTVRETGGLHRSYSFDIVDEYFDANEGTYLEDPSYDDSISRMLESLRRTGHFDFLHNPSGDIFIDITN